MGNDTDKFTPDYYFPVRNPIISPHLKKTGLTVFEKGLQENSFPLAGIVALKLK